MSENETGTTHTLSGETISQQIDTAHSAGRWMPWAGFGCALIWWGSAGGAALALVGPDGLSQFPLSLVLGAGFGGALPGFMLIMAGLMGRESTRSARANAIVMQAAARLLTPAREAGRDAETFADQMRDSTAMVDKAMGNALSAMKAMAGELGDERQRVESVAYASADNARDLSERLAEERQALEALAREIRAQTDSMSEAIPRQAAMMVQAAKTAGAEIAQADDALDVRLKSMDDAGKALAEKLTDLDNLAVDASTRSETMTYAVTRLEEKLEASRKTVDQAVRAGEMAAAAAGTTGDALKDAVSAALDGAREASSEIHALTLRASEEAAHSMAALRDTSQEAATAIRVAGMAARAEADISRPRLNTDEAFARTGHSPGDPQAEIRPQPQMTPTPMKQARRRKTDDRRREGDDDEALEAKNPAEDNELFEADIPPVNEHIDEPDNGNEASGEEPFVLRKRLEEDAVDDSPEPTRPETVTNGGSQQPDGDAAWRDILADMERDKGQAGATEMPPGLDREATSQELIDRLQGSGIELASTFRPKEKKRIATAADKGEHERRQAIRDTAGRQVERVAVRLKGSANLMELAHYFVVREEADALKALEETRKTGKNASSRLAAYLLVDAALGLTPSY